MARSLLRSLTRRTPAPVRRLDGLVVVPCAAPDHDLCVLWDPSEEQIVDVLPRASLSVYADEDDLWHEARSGWDHQPQAMAA